MKNNKLKGILFTGLAVLATVGLCACGKKGGKAVDPSAAKDYVFKYVTADIKNPGNGDLSVIGIGESEGKAFALMSSYEYNEDSYGVKLFLADVDAEGKTSGLKNVENPDLSYLRPEETPEGFWENSYYNYMTVLGDKIISTCDYNFSYSTDTDYFSTETTLALAWDKNGSFLWSANLTDELNCEYAYINSLSAGSDYVSLIMSGSYKDGGEMKAIVNIDGNGKIANVTKLDGSANIYKLLNTKDGKCVAMYYDDEYNTKAAYFDVKTGNIGDECVIPEFVISAGMSYVVPGYDKDFIFSNGQGIFKFSVGDTEAVKIMDPINSDLNGSNVSEFVFLDKDHFVGSYQDIENWEIQLAAFTYVDPSTIPDRKVITMAVYYMDSDVRKRVIDFNKESNEYRIVVKDYSQYSTADDWEAGYTKLNNDILAGDIPAILFFAPYTSIDYDSFAKKGMFVEIDELIKKDEELGSLSYLENVFDAYAINGKHYMLVPSFSYQTFMTSNKIAAGRTSLTIPEFLEIMKNAGPDAKPLEYCNQSNMLNYLMNFDGKEFINPMTNKCDLQSDDFVSMIDYIATLPEEANYDDDFFTNYYDQFRSGKILFTNMYISDLNNYQYQKYNIYEGESSLIGFPSREGQPGVIQSSGSSFILTNTASLDGAWDFVRYYLTPEYQNSISYGIPVLESAFDAWAAKGMEKPYYEDENGVKNYYENYYYIDDVEKIIPQMTQEEVDEVKNIIKSCTKSMYQNDKIMSIIEEECSGCFAKQKSAADVCGVIQSRVQLYINENN